MTQQVKAFRTAADPTEGSRSRGAEIEALYAETKEASNAEMSKILDDLTPENREALLRIARAMAAARQP